MDLLIQYTVSPSVCEAQLFIGRYITPCRTSHCVFFSQVLRVVLMIGNSARAFSLQPFAFSNLAGLIPLTRTANLLRC